MNYYVLGILAGAALSVGLFFLIRVLCKKRATANMTSGRWSGGARSFGRGSSPR